MNDVASRNEKLNEKRNSHYVMWYTELGKKYEKLEKGFLVITRKSAPDNMP